MCRLTQLVERRPRRRPTYTPWTRRPSPNPRGAQTAATTSLHKLAHARRGAGARNLSDTQKKALDGALARVLRPGSPDCVPAESLQSARRAPAHTPAAPPVAAVAAGGKACCTPVRQLKAVPVRVIRGVRALHAPGRSLQVLTGVPPTEVLKDMGAQLAAEGVGAELPARLFLRRAPLQGRHRRMSHQRGWQKARGRGPLAGGWIYRLWM